MVQVRRIHVVAAALLGAASPGAARPEEDPIRAQREAESAPVLYHTELRGELTRQAVDETMARLRRVPREDGRAVTIVLKLETAGGDVVAASELGQLLAKGLRPAHTVVWVLPGARVEREGLLVAFAAEELVLGPGSVLGRQDAPAIPPSELQPLVGHLRQLADDRGLARIKLEALAKPVDDELSLVSMRRGGEERWELFTRKDIEEERRKDAANISGDGQPLVAKGQRLELSLELARKLRLARHSASDLDQLLTALGVLAPPENVIDLDRTQVRNLVDVLNEPIVRFLLILCGALALLIEIKTLGTFVPGTVAVVCFAIFFVGHSFPTTGNLEGTASPWEILLFVVGVGLFAIEFLLLPGLAIFAITGAALCAASLVLAMIPGNESDLQHQPWADALRQAISILSYSTGTAGLAFFALLAYLPKSRFLASRGLVSTATISGVSTADSSIEAQAGQMALVGLRGTAQTTLRPAGKMELPDGRVLDVVAEEGYVEAGTPIAVTRSEDGVTRVTRTAS